MNIALEVSDLEASSRFYGEAIGLVLRDVTAPQPEDPWLSGPRRVAFDRRGRPKVSLRPAKAAPSAGLELGLVVDDLAQSHARAVQAGAPILHPPRQEQWGKTARYRDPDGNVVALTERQVEPVRFRTLVKWAGFAAVVAAGLAVAWYVWVLSGIE